MKLVPFCRPNMKAMMKSMAAAWLKSSTSTGFCSMAADSKTGSKRAKMIVWEILCRSGDD